MQRLGAVGLVVGLLSAVLLVLSAQRAELLSSPGADELLSSASLAADLKAEKSLKDFWSNLDQKTARTNAKVEKLQQERYAMGVGTRYNSHLAKDLFKARSATAPEPREHLQAKVQQLSQSRAVQPVPAGGINGNEAREEVSSYFQSLGAHRAQRREAEAKIDGEREARESKLKELRAAEADSQHSSAAGFWANQEKLDLAHGQKLAEQEAQDSAGVTGAISSLFFGSSKGSKKDNARAEGLSAGETEDRGLSSRQEKAEVSGMFRKMAKEDAWRHKEAMLRAHQGWVRRRVSEAKVNKHDWLKKDDASVDKFFNKIIAKDAQKSHNSVLSERGKNQIAYLRKQVGNYKPKDAFDVDAEHAKQGMERRMAEAYNFARDVTQKGKFKSSKPHHVSPSAARKAAVKAGQMKQKAQGAHLWYPIPEESQAKNPKASAAPKEAMASSAPKKGSPQPVSAQFHISKESAMEAAGEHHGAGLKPAGPNLWYENKESTGSGSGGFWSTLMNLF